MTQNLNLNVNVEYRLTVAGQRAALLAGRPATGVVKETRAEALRLAK